MAIGDEITLSVEKIAMGGDGLAEHEGKKVFIPFGAPGDLVKARITEEHGAWAQAEIVEIYEFSPDRVKPACPLYGECGGCSLQHLSYEAQLEAKKVILAGLLSKTVRKGMEPIPDVLPIVSVIPSKPWEYRNRVSLHAIRRAGNAGNLALNFHRTGHVNNAKPKKIPCCGFKARKSNEIIPLDDCLTADGGIRNILPHLLPPPGKDRFTLYSLGSTLIAETGASVAEDGKNRRQIPNRGIAALLGREITLEASSFFQSNAEALEKLLCRLRETAEKTAANTGKTGKMADLYAGAATLSLFLTDLFPQGTDLVEADSGALELAKINLAKINQKGAFRFFPQKTDHWAQKRNLGGYDFIVADPPRQGLSPLLVRSLCQSGPPVFVYISCEAAAFARDYGSLARYYNPESIFLFDFYPQTPHIETMAVFIRK